MTDFMIRSIIIRHTLVRACFVPEADGDLLSKQGQCCFGYLSQHLTQGRDIALNIFLKGFCFKTKYWDV